MKETHLSAALAAFFLLTAVLFTYDQSVQAVEFRYVQVIGPLHPPIMFTGSALQEQALRHTDLLSVYGSSEVLLQSSQYDETEFFRNYPTGFATFEVANGGVTALTLAQLFAALGPELRGKKIVISFSPAVFRDSMVPPDQYAGLFSRLHADALIFSTDLSLDVKQAAARRMLHYPGTLKRDPLLSFAVHNLDDGSLVGQALYYVALPLGQLQTLVLRLQDHWEVLTWIQLRPKLNPDVPHEPAEIDWRALQLKTRQEQIPATNNNPYGIDNTFWIQHLRSDFTPRPAGFADDAYLRQINSSAEWTDLDIMLRVLKQFGAQPLLLSRPISGPYFDAYGVSAKARQGYYNLIRKEANRYGVPLVTFQDFDEDKYFNVDPASHTSPYGWIYVDQVLDAFYHGNPLPYK